MTRWLPVLAFLIALLSCKKTPTTEDALESVEAEWTVAAHMNVTSQAGLAIDEIQAEDGLDGEVAGHTASISNYISDSRETVMDFGEWNRLLRGYGLSEEDRLKRVAMIGLSGTVYPFTGTGGNKGFLVFSTANSPKAWAEVWDHQGIQRVRLDFEGKVPTVSEVTLIVERLAGLEWPQTN